MNLAEQMILLMQSSGAVTPTNTVAPSISATSTIGTQINGNDGTWTGSPTFTYQWQRNTGSFVNIGGATSKNYTPVDADFGYALRLVVTPSSGSAANSNNTNLTLELPAQSLGSELVANGNFSAWTADNPSSWSVIGEAGTSAIHQVGTGEDHTGVGTGMCNIYKSDANFPQIRQTILTVGSYYEMSVLIDKATSGTMALKDTSSGAGGMNLVLTAAGQKRTNGYAGATSIALSVSTNPGDFTMDNASVKLMTLNTQLVAPSANMRISQFYTLPASPVQGDSIWLMPRISDFAAGNFWLVLLEYTGAQWNITLYSAASHVLTSRTSAANIGATNGMRINMNGDLLDLQTTADSGGVWTTRGTQVNNALYNTATGVNVLASSSFTLANTQYEGAV